jgi:hypothetical protein
LDEKHDGLERAGVSAAMLHDMSEATEDVTGDWQLAV